MAVRTLFSDGYSLGVGRDLQVFRLFFSSLNYCVGFSMNCFIWKSSSIWICCIISFWKCFVVPVILSLYNYWLYVLPAWVVSQVNKIQHGLHPWLVFQIQMIVIPPGPGRDTACFLCSKLPYRHRPHTTATWPKGEGCTGVAPPVSTAVPLVTVCCCSSLLLPGVPLLGIEHLCKCSHL